MASDARSSPLSGPRRHLRAIGGSLAVVLLVVLLASVAVSLGYPLLDAAGIAYESALGLALRSTFQFIGFGVAGVGFLVVTNQLDLVPVRLPTRGDLKWLAIGFAALLGLYVGSSAILSALGVQGADSVIVDQGSGQPVYFLYLIPVTILLVGPTEELIFRGIVQGLFRRAYGPRVAIAAASAIFAAVHISSYSGDGLYVTLGTILVLGGTLGVVYEKSENLVVPAVVHGLFNTAQFAVVYASTTGLLG
ncbi:CPBP family intramembrane glutamic endopeptidase [Halobellus captivus]|uniref:CPBP family intramembrane glutamic endopeptidase n=1 Tax=Halobellus captivus TaxID=2592614 RepID=UPI00119F2025|nr:CPBP family intramembrane glutamic endopeptidase [Halobellus captivus]